MTSFSVTSFKKAISEFQKDLAKFLTQQSWIPYSCPDNPVKHSDTLLCLEDSDSAAYIRLDVRAIPSGCSSVFKKNPEFLCRHRSGKTACTRPDSRATSPGHGLNKETREARYGKAVAQFTVWMLFASVLTPPREI
jgi:hypothetical protein